MGGCQPRSVQSLTDPPVFNAFLSADELLHRGIAIAQAASVEKNSEKRKNLVQVARIFLREALDRVDDAARSDFAAAHIASVLVCLGDDPASVREAFEETRRDRTAEILQFLAFSPVVEHRVKSNETADDSPVALKSLKHGALASGGAAEQPDTAAKAGDIYENTIQPNSYMKTYNLNTNTIHHTLRQPDSEATLSIRLYNPISGEEELRHSLNLRSLLVGSRSAAADVARSDMTLVTTAEESSQSMVRMFRHKLSLFMVFYCGYDLSRLQHLSLDETAERPQLRPFDEAVARTWLHEIHEEEPILRFCPMVVARSEHLEVFQNALRVVELRPSVVTLEVINCSPWRPEDAAPYGEPTQDEPRGEFFVSVETNMAIPCEGRSLSLTLTDQRDSGRTIVFPMEGSATLWRAKIDTLLLRPRNEEDAAVYDVYIVIDHNFRSMNRKTLSVVPDDEEDIETGHIWKL
jgi:hypothetical protein